ncbi:TIGR01620 family protein [Endozoicomonas sp. SM1973]|uniref:TIGR01620 family protein n=1 Tax=Spartinivicinus marinus TaxID=2994442 RepID=A0A853IBK3_9GAMM|nr:TIGR01620 family protein [Spartinivicinus marinus]MCX4028442.1 TIGR01620 family protein [Spartinivicinus marinus]NYZ67444.1 TIGR01620 family protein [Spartinivicinus marinus]
MSKQDEQLHQAVHFDKSLAEQQQPEKVQQRQDFSADQFTPKLEQPIEQALPLAPQPTKSLTGRWLLIAAGLVGAGALAELTWFLVDQWQHNQLIATAYTAGVALLVACLSKVLFGELRSLTKLKKLRQWQRKANRLQQSEQQGEAIRFVKRLSQRSGYRTTDGYQQWLNAVNSSHNDAEVLTLYSQTVLKPLDSQAEQIVYRWSSEAALLVAISPLAITDMLILGWRNIKMIDKLCEVYGVKLGYWSRISLIRTVFRNMVYTGATELIADIGMDLLGAELAGRVSTRFTQGMGAGLLTARLGYQAINLCRPIPFAVKQKPRLKHIYGQLMTYLKQQFMDNLLASVKPGSKQQLSKKSDGVSGGSPEAE